MENVEHSQIENMTAMTQNDCCDGDGHNEDHVIDQNQQALDKVNANANILELAESSSATIGFTNQNSNSSPQQQVELENHVDVEPIEAVNTVEAAAVDKSLAESQTPMDLTRTHSNKNKCDIEEIQSEPYNLKIDAVQSIPSIVDNLNIVAATPNDAVEATITTINNACLDLQKTYSRINDENQSSMPAEASQSAILTVNEFETADVASTDDDKSKISIIAPQNESILDLSVNNSNEDSKSPTFSADNETYQTRFSEIKQESSIHSKEKQTPEHLDEISTVKLNGSHAYIPEESCESVVQNTNFVEKDAYESEKDIHVEDVKKESIELNNLSPKLAENTQEPTSNCSISNNLDKLPVEQTAEHFSETNNLASVNELNESRYSSSDSLNSTASTLRSSSSHQLIIDQAPEDDKVPPLRLKLKRKHRKSSSSLESLEPAKRANIEEAETINLNEENFEETSVACNTNFSTAMLTKTSPTELLESSTALNIPIVNDVTANDVDTTPPPPQEIRTEEPIKQQINQFEICENNSIDDSLMKESLNTIIKPTTTSQYYKCTACGTYHENWSFFLHLQEKHDRFLCLYCIKCFPTAEKLALHLEIKHDLEQNHFNTEEAFRNSALIIRGFSVETRFLMCCTCQYIFRENAAFTEHACIEFMKSCMQCGQKGRHTSQCKANPTAKRRNKKKIRQKPKPPNLENLPQIEPTLKPPPPPTSPLQTQPPPPVFNDLDTSIQQQQLFAQQTPIRRHSEESNSSSNMVIDESCNTNHNLLPNQINPFKALDETERMEQEEAMRARNVAIEPNADSLLNNVFKFKLRVPKEFQKPVDEEISTSESEHAENYDDEAADINSNQIEFKNNAMEEYKTRTATPTLQQTPLGYTEQQVNVETPLLQSEDESVDDTTANAHLARILQEIEQTKLDIEKTKETLHQRHVVQQPRNENTAASESEIAVKSNLNTVAADEHWTPTPPASPHRNVEVVIAKPADDVPPNEENPENTQAITENMETENMESLHENVSPHENVPPLPENPVIIEATKETTTNANETIFVPSSVSVPVPAPPPPPDDGIEVANEDCLLVELQLDRPLDQFETVEFVRICLKATYPYCLYCNHARRIAVNAESLVLHLIAQHRFMATVDSITAEELQPSTLVAKLKSFLPELQDQYMNMSSYCTIGDGRFTRHFNERIFECFQCRFITSTHKELYLHNRKMHLRTAILCFMCRCNFYSFSEILCHICPGVPHRVSIFEINFHCCLCDLTEIPSPFRLMVHLRKRHFACDICLEDCRDQSKLSSHVWKHKLHHLCYRCGIAYRNKLDITKHLFWKHGTESALCKRCLQKRWPHVYHFCVPPAIFSCDVCQLCFSKAMYLTVHKRLHQNDFRYACTEANCQEKFISRKLLLKHSKVHENASVSEIVKDENDLSGEPQQMHEEKAENDESKQNETKLQVADSEANTEADVDIKVKSEIESLKQEGTDKKTIDDKVKPEENQQVQQPKTPNAASKADEQTTITSIEQPSNEKKHKKRKKRAKESLEDLNLTAPNLSESGSSSESDSETKSNATTNTRHELALSPLSEHGDTKVPEQTAGSELTSNANNEGNVLDIWKNFLQAQQQAGSEVQQYAEYTEDDYPTPKCIHVCMSDHDYCAMYPKIQENKETKTPPNTPERAESISGDRTRNFSTSSTTSDNSSSSSSCSCGSNCSCSNGSSSSSSTGDSSDSSSASATKKRLRKKSERSNRHRKSFSSSPLKQQQQQQQALNTSGGGADILNVIDTDDPNAAPQQEVEETSAANAEDVSKTNLEPTINESDLETAESETDEEYYDEHPQKLATELLSQKRAQLMARTLLSPSHNFDIVENSRPSTPSLPEDVIYEKRQKKKKNKRDRKSTSNNKMLATIAAAAPPPTANELHEYLTAAAASLAQHSNSMELTTIMSTEQHLIQNQTNAYMPPHTLESSAHSQPRITPLTTQANHQHHHYIPRISEGSSCSDADYSLKRSKRQRRPNKFYGYTSDDESMAPAAVGQSLVIGIRTYKPLPPPQLVWDKEDLPTPEKSILNVNKKTKSQQLSTPNTSSAGIGDEHTTKKKKTATHRKRSSGKHSTERQKLPPIPRLKIRSALFNRSTEASDLGLGDSSDSASSDIEQNSIPPTRKRAFPQKHLYSSSSLATAQAQAPPSIYLPRYPPNQMQQPQTNVVATFAAPPPPPTTPLPPTPQTTAFNHKIPPALLPNPDFSTLQYFKANNIRYPIRPPAGARAAREGESVYCYCRCPYDEVSEMIACDGDNCLIEWFHFECVGIMLAPQGKWFCAECRPQYSEELYPTTVANSMTSTNLN